MRYALSAASLFKLPIDFVFRVSSLFHFQCSTKYNKAHHNVYLIYILSNLHHKLVRTQKKLICNQLTVHMWNILTTLFVW